MPGGPPGFPGGMPPPMPGTDLDLASALNALSASGLGLGLGLPPMGNPMAPSECVRMRAAAPRCALPCVLCRMLPCTCMHGGNGHGGRPRHARQQPLWPVASIQDWAALLPCIVLKRLMGPYMPT